jgi:hypothetical protein
MVLLQQKMFLYVKRISLDFPVNSLIAMNKI